MKAIINTKLIMEDGIIWDGALLYEGDKIVAADWKDKVEVPKDAEIIDANGLYTAPGLIDIHNHGCREYWFYENPQYVSDFFIKHGVTTVLPTFYHIMSKEDMKNGAAKIREISKHGTGKIMDGLYMEGPFMSLSGSSSSQIKWHGAVCKEDYAELIESFGDMVRVWAIDPNRENIEEFMAYAKEHTPHAIFAHGHSKAGFEQIKALKHYGVKVRTHITDSGRPIGRAQGTPGAGGDEFALYDPDMYAELICDQSAVHVEPGLMKLFVKIKGAERICLISDHTTCGENNYKNDEEGGIWYGPDLNYDDIGWLAGSLMTIDNAVKNIMTHTPTGLCQAIRMASLTPAELLGIDNRVGSLKKGKTANLILIDDAVNIKKVILEGETAVENGEIVL
ncbi:MAG: amidohydrolase family protein [Clostridia bacterium]|nr:amidohydrolase family protein [Clostridia bacterium]